MQFVKFSLGKYSLLDRIYQNIFLITKLFKYLPLVYPFMKKDVTLKLRQIVNIIYQREVVTFYTQLTERRFKKL